MVAELLCQRIMTKWLQWIQRYTHGCLHCGSFNKSDGLLCDPCRGTLCNYIPDVLETKTLAIFESYSLFKWNPGTSNMLSAQLVGLKGMKKQKDWEYWAAKFLSRRVLQGLPQRRIIIIPAPGSGAGKDHAFQWAEALANYLGAEVHPCLSKTVSRHQRGASREQRVEVRFELDENSSLVSELWTEALWVFADDIVTTGSTALAAFEALGSPPHFEVWSLARRTLTCSD